MTDNATFKGGYHDASSNLLPPSIVVQHAWVTAQAQGNLVQFPCYGGPGGADPSAPAAELYANNDFAAPSPRTTVTADLDLAILVTCGVKPKAATDRRAIYDRVYGVVDDKFNPGLGWPQGDSCGLFYGISGVCHQAANRILCAANGAGPVDPATLVMVPHWSGLASMLAYGTLGILFDGFWSVVCLLNEGRPVDHRRVAEDQMAEHLATAAHPQTRRRLLDPLVGQGMVRQGSPELAAIVAGDASFAQQKLQLDKDMLIGQIAPAAFAKAVNDLTAAQARRVAQILGPEWAAAGASQHGIVNPEWMADPHFYRQFAHLVK